MYVCEVSTRGVFLNKRVECSHPFEGDSNPFEGTSPWGCSEWGSYSGVICEVLERPAPFLLSARVEKLPLIPSQFQDKAQKST